MAGISQPDHVYLTRDYYGGEKVAVFPKSAIFFPVNNFHVVITCAQPGSLKSLELCQESSMVNHVSQQKESTHQTWPCLYIKTFVKAYFEFTNSEFS